MDASATSITAASQKLEVNNEIPLKHYYGLAKDLLKQAGIHRQEKDFVDLYIILLRFSSLVLETIPSHQDYKSKHRKKRNTFWRKAVNAISEIESLRTHVECHVNEPNNMPNLVGLERPSRDHVEQAGSASQSSEKQDNDLDDDASCGQSKIYSNAEACLHGEGTAAPSTDNQSLKEESILDNSDLKRDEVMSEINTKGDKKFDSGICFQLKHSIANIALLKQEIYEESCKRRRAEKFASEAACDAQESEKLYAKEMKQRIKMEEALIELMLKLEDLKNNRDEMFQELKKTQEQKESLETKISAFERKLIKARPTDNVLHVESGVVLEKVEELTNEEVSTDATMPSNALEFSSFELEEATQNFDISMKIGDGRCGSIYKGLLRYTTLAIKTVDPKCRQGQAEFLEEVCMLNSVRHPNLINLIGICPETQSLVYEFIPNGSLEEHLDGNTNYSPISWQARINIASEICSTLAFLHSCKPHRMVHGNLKPSNVLFDSHFLSKICWLNIHNRNSTAICGQIDLNYASAYMDPDFLSTDKLTTESDIYSFGVIILRLLTGRPALGIIEEVVKALVEENLHNILDRSAGEWPFVQAKQLAHLGVRCCESNPRNRPHLGSDALRVLEPMRRASSMRPPLAPSFLHADEPPSYFLCPILQEIMRDPQVAADGFTYEAEAVRGWFDSGHDTSPMTNVKLLHKGLLPNHALRSAIQEWLQQRGKQR